MRPWNPSLAGVASALLSLANATVDAADRPSRENSIGMELIRLEPGTYTRGFDGDGPSEHAFWQAHLYSSRHQFEFERPPHRVRLTEGFEIAATEVTVGQFRSFVDATGYLTEAEQGGAALGFFPDERNYVDRFQSDASVTWRDPGFPQSERHPVVAVSWTDSVAFCDWLSEKEGRSYRLPTEAEWEYGYRAGETDWYFWGTDPDGAYTRANVADGALEAAHENTTRYQRAVRLEDDEGDGYVYTAPVARFLPNAWGLYDMSGNVWEWVQDRWSEDVYERFFDGLEWNERRSLVVTDPVFLEETDQHAFGDWRVMRGGAWTCAPASVRATIRTFAEAGDAAVYTGFRVVCDLVD